MVNQEGEDTGEMVMGNDYRVLTTAYLAEGNSGFVKFKDAAHLPTNAQLPMFQVLLYHISESSHALFGLGISAHQVI